MIELRHLCAGYGSKPVLHGLSLTLEPGQLTAVIGPNGSGKSTLLKTIAGLLPASAGQILLDNADCGALSRQQMARRIAYLSQGTTTPDMTLGQMVLHGRFPHLQYPRRYSREDRRIAQYAMARMDITHLADSLLAELSGGMRQKAYIAMALAQDTDYIFLDEPTTYLDISHQLELMNTLRQLATNGKGIVTVMHDLPMAFTFSDRILLIREGHITADGAPARIAQNPAVEAAFGVSVQYDSLENTYCYGYCLH